MRAGDRRRARYDEVETEGARALLDAGAVLIDVRTRWEWDRGHVPGALHVPLERVRTSGAVPRGVPVVTICRSGHRSALAARILARGGHRAASVAGGLPAWTAAGGPVTEPREGAAPARSDAFIAAPRRIPLRLLTWYPRAAIGAAALEAFAVRPVGRVDARMLQLVRMTASWVVSCPFCVGMNGRGWERLLTEAELDAVQGRRDPADVPTLAPRDRRARRRCRAGEPLGAAGRGTADRRRAPPTDQRGLRSITTWTTPEGDTVDVMSKRSSSPS